MGAFAGWLRHPAHARSHHHHTFTRAGYTCDTTIETELVDRVSRLGGAFHSGIGVRHRAVRRLERYCVRQGIKKGPVRDLLSAHGWQSPDGYTILPMRDITTTRSVAIFMDDRANRKMESRQRLLSQVTASGAKQPQSGFPFGIAKKQEVNSGSARSSTALIPELCGRHSLLPRKADKRPRRHGAAVNNMVVFAYRGRTVEPIKASSIERAAWRPSRIAQTTSDCPRRTSPAVQSLSTEVL